MITEHFESNSNIKYDESTSSFETKNNSLLGFLNFSDNKVYEKNIGITKINELRESAEATTLTNYDIELLYSYAKKKFNYNNSKYAFLNTPLKDIYINDKDPTISKLMIAAYDTIKN
jgi:hypothetical protein